ncbi:isoprenylcysteine carboxylmethyltransferase family protein [Candidatus Binatia bacterium]|nr:isoprenylcysteine carboxylmethyltransferase family protein [Candidatus Binatia bacterium]
MPYAALTGYFVFAGLAFGWRSWVHWQQTGSTGYRGLSGRPGSVEWWGGLLFAFAIVLTPLAAVLQARGTLSPLIAPRASTALVLGGTLYLAGLAGTLWSQLAMGTSWRIGVDAQERTALITRGPYGVIRNPIFTFMVLGLAGLAVLAPNALSILALAVLIAAVEIQVKAVEEPYLERTHGDAYRCYRAGTWRFVPGIGR